jgi:ATP-dependent Clp protease ATP-binding subunit ClpA
LQRYVESPLSVQLLQGKFVKGDCVLIDVADNELTFVQQEEFIVPEEVVESTLAN